MKTSFEKKYLTRWSEDNFKEIVSLASELEMKPMEFVRLCVNEKIREMKGKKSVLKVSK